MDRPQFRFTRPERPRFTGLSSSPRRIFAALALGIVSVTACKDDPVQPPVPPPPATSPEGVVAALGNAYRTRCFECVDELLAPMPEAEFSFVPFEPMQDGTVAWGIDTERLVTRRMLRPDRLEPGELPVPPQLWLTRMSATFSQETPFVERPDLYASPANPTGLPPSRWKAQDATYTSNVLVETQGETDYLITVRDNFVVLEDLSKDLGDAGKFWLYSWEELGPPVGVAGIEEGFWSGVKSLYAAASPITSEASFIQSLADAYGRRDVQGYTSLLGTDFLFLLEPTDGGDVSWGRAEEIRIHRRMFEPQDVPPGDLPVPPDLWLERVTITLTPQSPFVERPDLYLSSTNPGGLDPDRWRATEATYAYAIFWELHGQTDYLTQGLVSFVVTADRRRLTGTPGRFSLYRCEELGSTLASVAADASPAVAASSEALWSTIKKLYQ